MSNRTLGVIKRLGVIVGGIVYLVLASRTVLFLLFASKNMSWFTVSGSFGDWVIAVMVAAIGTYTFYFIFAELLLPLCQELWIWLIRPRSKELEADKARALAKQQAEEEARRNAVDTRGEPIKLRHTTVSDGEYRNPPVYT